MTLIRFYSPPCPYLPSTLPTRVFVNRSISMDRIKYVGFDMDYTLVGEQMTCASRVTTVLA